MGGEGEGLLGGGVVLPMKRRQELAVGWGVGSVVSAKLSCLALSMSGERERQCVFVCESERDRGV